jgi:hypothetical protein
MVSQALTISLREILDWMNAGHSFSILAYSYNKKKKAAGKQIKYGEAKLLGADSKAERDGATKPEVAPVQSPIIAPITKNPKRPNHGKNMTRNIRPCISGVPVPEKIVKIHIDLIVRFNGRQVILP